MIFAFFLTSHMMNVTRTRPQWLVSGASWIAEIAENVLDFYMLVVGLGLSQFAVDLANDINNSLYVIKPLNKLYRKRNMNFISVCTILLLELIWISNTKNMYPSLRKQHSIYKGCIQVSVPFWLDLATSIDRLHFLRVRTIYSKPGFHSKLYIPSTINIWKKVLTKAIWADKKWTGFWQISLYIK